MHRRRRQQVTWGTVALTAIALLLAAARPSAARPPAGDASASVATPPARTLSVLSAAQLSTAIAQARPGDRILVADGTTLSTPIRVSRSGTPAAPITIVARSPGKALVTAPDAFRLDGASHVVISGFHFGTQASLQVPGSAAAVRVTRNTFTSNRSGHQLTVKANDTEVDHNLFKNKSTSGSFIQAVGEGSRDMPQRVHIHHNHFLNHRFRGGNGGESIRFGLSGRQHAKAYGLIEHNLFEKCDGDYEVISIKSSDNTIRYNTIVNSKGTITLRHGHRSVLDGNLLLGNKAGIRIFGNDHVVVNNVVQNTRGQPPIEVGGGAIKDDTNSTTDHEAADRVLVAFNTVTYRGGDLVKFGGGKRYGPSDTRLANNVFVGAGKLINRGQAVNPRWEGNIVHGGAAGDIPAGGYRAVDPRLTAGPGGLQRLQAGSPAIGTAVGTFAQVGSDVDAQVREEPKDVGADEFSVTGQRAPLTPADVGPTAP